eukprot:Gb_14045 [translate_table: standard]
MKVDTSAYEMHNVIMRKKIEYLVVKVLELSKKRPSLIFRDAKYVITSGMNGNTIATRLYNSRVAMRGYEFEKPAGGIVSDRKEGEAFKQGIPNGNIMYLRNPNLSCGPPSRIEDVYSQTRKNRVVDKNE